MKRLVTALAVASLAGCGASDGGSTDEVAGTVTVFASAGTDQIAGALASAELVTSAEGQHALTAAGFRLA